jgi:hypothetical protein
MLEEHLNIPTNSGFSMETINHDIRNKNTNWNWHANNWLYSCGWKFERTQPWVLCI